MSTHKLVVAEKPSVAKSIAAVLGAKRREDGFFIGNGYIVTWCFGHLAGLAEPEVYDRKFSKWRYEDLPILPEVWQYSVPRDKKKQLDLIRGLMHRKDVDEVINACDAGREGELIFRTVYNLTGCNKPMKRLWISSMEDAAIEVGFANLRDGAEFENLYISALCRSKADWLVGINATRLFSTLYHRTLNVGRVVSPTLAMLVEREAAIKAFRSEPYFTANLQFEGFTATSERMNNREEAEKLATDCRGQTAIVKSVGQKNKTEKAPALYDLTTLQREANRHLGYTAQQTLDYAQSLYEKKYITYPRTDSRYLTDEMEGSVKALVLLSTGILNADAPFVVNGEQICNSKKVSDHHAIIPTKASGEIDLSTLPAGEHEVLMLIARQVLMAVSPSHTYTETTATLSCNGKLFTAKGKRVTNVGWKLYENKEETERFTPGIAEGQVLSVIDTELKDGATTPPKHHTEDTLLSAMEAAGAKEMPDDAERKGIGTPATRAGVIEKLVSGGFVERRKAKKTTSLVPVSVAESLITVLPEQLQSPLLTAEWEHKLKQIEHGELDGDTFMCEISDMVTELVRSYQIVPGAEVLFPSGRTVVGKCPRCGSDVTESKKGYFCERTDCRFGLWRDNQFLTEKKIHLTKKMVSALLQDGRTYASGIYSEKTGKPYNAFIVLEDDGTRTSYRLDFNK